jgi:hypothetical protein
MSPVPKNAKTGFWKKVCALFGHVTPFCEFCLFVKKYVKKWPFLRPEKPENDLKMAAQDPSETSKRGYLNSIQTLKRAPGGQK